MVNRRPRRRFDAPGLCVAASVAVALSLSACGRNAPADTSAAAADTSPAIAAVASDTSAVSAGVDTTAVGESPPVDNNAAASDAAGAETTAAGATASVVRVAPDVPTTPIVLTATAVGEVHLGDDAETALAGLVSLLGPPASDSGWLPGDTLCSDMGSRKRDVSWNTFEAFFATGPTELVKKPGDHLSAYYLLDASFEDGPGPSADRFTLSDGRPALRRTIAELQAWNPSVERFNSEIEGPIWTTGGSSEQLSGAISTDSDAEPERSTTVRAGLFCID